MPTQIIFNNPKLSHLNTTCKNSNIKDVSLSMYNLIKMVWIPLEYVQGINIDDYIKCMNVIKISNKEYKTIKGL